MSNTKYYNTYIFTQISLFVSLFGKLNLQSYSWRRKSTILLRFLEVIIESACYLHLIGSQLRTSDNFNSKTLKGSKPCSANVQREI